jgi:DNA primase large subunit
MGTHSNDITRAWATPQTNVNAETAFDERRKDHVSHFILRLAYCRSEDLRRWFLTHECELFRHRFDAEDGDSVTEFLRLNGLNYTPISQSMKEERLNKLASVGFANNAEKVMHTDYFKVDFEEAGELIKSRRVCVPPPPLPLPSTLNTSRHGGGRV